MSAATDAKYRQGWADGKVGRDPDPGELAYVNAYERGYIDSGHFEVPRVAVKDASEDEGAV